MSAFKRNQSSNIDEEFLMATLTPSMLLSLPQDSILNDFQKNLISILEHQTNYISLIERMGQRIALDKKIIELLQNLTS